MAALWGRFWNCEGLCLGGPKRLGGVHVALSATAACYGPALSGSSKQHDIDDFADRSRSASGEGQRIGAGEAFEVARALMARLTGHHLTVFEPHRDRRRVKQSFVLMTGSNSRARTVVSMGPCGARPCAHRIDHHNRNTTWLLTGFLANQTVGSLPQPRERPRRIFTRQ